MQSLRIDHIPGPPREAGAAHGRLIRPLLAPTFMRTYLSRLGEALKVPRAEMSEQAARWLVGLPPQYQEEIAGMAEGAGVDPGTVATFLYADIARTSEPSVDPTVASSDDAVISGGPMCSAVISRLDDEATWIGRNCDWLVPTLLRGTSAVVHETPHRIPVMAVGIRGDIDVDTGINAERLWLHLHTLQARDDPPRDRTCISWLFWAREALETCATLAELERFIATTGRDRGVFVVAGEGATNAAAIFECSRASHVRYDVDPARAACVTNHTLRRSHDAKSQTPRRTGGTIGRYQALRANLDERAPRSGPHDLIGLLAAPDVEMGHARWLRTIYSAVVRPEDASIWFAAGDADGTPAASGGRWTRVRPPWESKAR